MALLRQHSWYVKILPNRKLSKPTPSQGRAGLVAWRRSRGGLGALGQAFYKGGFEPRMTRREASLILSLKYETPVTRRTAAQC